MRPQLQSSLYDELQREFCPPLDTSLVAALVAELDQHHGPDYASHLRENIQSLRNNLRILAEDASVQVEQQLSVELAAVHLSQVHASDTDSTSTPEFYSYTGDTTTTTTISSSPSSISESISELHHPFSSPLGFLQAALPHIPLAKLRKAINDVAGDGCDVDDESEIDMERVIETLLTSEYIREERRVDELDFDVDEGLPTSVLEREGGSWEVVGQKNKQRQKSRSMSSGSVLNSPLPNTRRKQTRPRRMTIPLTDIRQKNRSLPSTSKPTSESSSHSKSNSLPAPDPWTQLSSLATYIANLTRSDEQDHEQERETSYFRSYFHNPSYDSPATALRAALTSITSSPHQTDTSTLSTLLDILRTSPEYSSRLISDAHLAFGATSGRVDDALDLVWLLNDLDADDKSGEWMRGMYHEPPPESPSGAWNMSDYNSPGRNVSSHAAPTSPAQHSQTSRATARSQSASPPPTCRSSDSQQWQIVSTRKPPRTNGYPHSTSLSTQSRDISNPRTAHGGGNAQRKPHAQSLRLNHEMTNTDLVQKQNTLLFQAANAWKKRSHGRGWGEVAAHCAERAREVGEEIWMERVQIARELVEGSRSKGVNHDTIDLHRTSVGEAVIIVREILERDGCSPSRPLKIITGRGVHSRNRVGVLRPAVKNALTEDGWNVVLWDGGLVVKGRKS